MKLMVKQHNVETGEIIEREMNAAELADYENAQIEAEEIATKQAQAKAAKETAFAKLSALGLDLDDLKALGF